MQTRINDIPVTKAFLPPFDEYCDQVKRAFDNAWLTNRGPLVRELEEELLDYLGVERLLLMCNGTLPIQIAIRLVEEASEVITTPFSYVATSSAVVWEHYRPVFVDIEPDTLTIDPSKIEAAITPRTKCILGTHVFGNPCDVDAIHEIAQRHGLFVLYDAAHCFGVKFNGRSIFSYGDVSTCSFHATKLFHTAEGGAVITSNPEYLERMTLMHSFGHIGPDNYYEVGINAKMSELQAAMGLTVMQYVDGIIDSRRDVVNAYKLMATSLGLETQSIRLGTEWNYSYFPVIYPCESTLKRAQLHFNSLGVFPRRYFYPSLNTLPFFNPVRMPISESVASRVMCLPLYAFMSSSEIDRVISALESSL